MTMEPGVAEEVADGPTQQFLTFILDREEYGLDILSVQEIKGWTPPTPVPNTPPNVLGVTNLRGTIVPIIDLRRTFGLDPAQCDKTRVTIVVNILAAGRRRSVGFVADAVADVCNVDATHLATPPEGAQTRYVRGLATLDERMLILLEVDRLVEDAVQAARADDGPDTEGS